MVLQSSAMVRSVFILLSGMMIFYSCNTERKEIPIEWTDETDTLTTWWYQKIEFAALNEMSFYEFDYLGIYRIHYHDLYEYNMIIFELTLHSCDSIEVSLKLYGNVTYSPPKIDTSPECEKTLNLGRAESVALYRIIVKAEEWYDKLGTFSEWISIKNFKNYEVMGVGSPVIEGIVPNKKSGLKFISFYWLGAGEHFETNYPVNDELCDYLLDIMTGKVLTINCDDLNTNHEQQ